MTNEQMKSSPIFAVGIIDDEYNGDGGIEDEQSKTIARFDNQLDAENYCKQYRKDNPDYTDELWIDQWFIDSEGYEELNIEFEEIHF